MWTVIEKTEMRAYIIIQNTEQTQRVKGYAEMMISGKTQCIFLNFAKQFDKNVTN